MPMAPKRPCREPGCTNFCDTGTYCEKHRKERVNAYEAYRGNSASRGYDVRWRKARRVFLDAHPLCAECQKQGRLTPATVVDHIIPHRGDQRLFWDTNNWQPLCASCHSTKTILGQ